MQCGGCRRIDPERQERIIKATLANIQHWQMRAEALADAVPAGSKSEALSLARDLFNARLSLARLAGLGDQAS